MWWVGGIRVFLVDRRRRATHVPSRRGCCRLNESQAVGGGGPTGWLTWQGMNCTLAAPGPWGCGDRIGALRILLKIV